MSRGEHSRLSLQPSLAHAIEKSLDQFGRLIRHIGPDPVERKLRLLTPHRREVVARFLDAPGLSKARATQAVRALKAQLPHDISVAGPNLAAQAIRAGLVDEYHLLVVPMMLGSGKRVLPSNARIKLDLVDERRFVNGMVYLRYHAQV